MHLKFVDILNSISMFQLILFIFFLLNKSKNRISNFYLVAFFISQFLSISNHFISSQKEFFVPISPHIFYIGLPFPFLWTPFFYFYIKSLLFSDFQFKAKHLIHLVPFAFYFVITLLSFHIQGFEEKTHIIINSELFSVNFGIIANVLVSLQISIYLVIVFVMRNHYKKNLNNKQSTINPKQNTWLNIFTYGYLIAFLITIACRIGLLINGNQKDLFVFISFFSFFIYFILLFTKAIANPDIFLKIEEKPEVKTNSIPKQEAHILLMRVNDYMTFNEPYLNPELSLKQLASELKIPERLLSGVINQYRDQNFYDFINDYRISKAKNLLTNSASKKKTVLEILYESGFNSKSTFNQVFKKHTGLTPTEFKQAHKPA